MGRRTLYILSCREVAAKVARVAVQDEVVPVGCISEIQRLDRRTWLIVEPTHLSPCCKKQLAAWRRRRAGHLQIVFIGEPASGAWNDAEVAFAATLRMSLDQLAKLLSEGELSSDQRRAWALQRDDPAPSGQRGLTHRLLALLERAMRSPRAVGVVARTLSMSPRRLHRLCLRWYGQPPHVVLGLLRVRAVARDLEDRMWTVERIAQEQGYRDASALSRQFMRFVGMRPGAYRRYSGTASRNRDTMLSDSAIDGNGKQL